MNENIQRPMTAKEVSELVGVTPPSSFTSKFHSQSEIVELASPVKFNELPKLAVVKSGKFGDKQIWQVNQVTVKGSKKAHQGAAIAMQEA